MPNELVFAPQASTDMFIEDPVLGEINNNFGAGNLTGDDLRGAIRFRNVTISQGTSISRAGIVLRGSFFNSGNWKVRIRGMDSDNVNSLNTGNPYGIYPQTLAESTVDTTSPNTGDDIDITGIVQEILNRGGWSSGNSLGIFMENNGSDTNRYYNDSYSSAPNDTLLSIRVANPNLTPTPKSVSAPTFPSTLGYGMKISVPGVPVQTATESQLRYTSDKKYMRILAEGEITTTAGVQYLIAHGQASTPQGIAFVRADGKSFELPRLFGGVTDPITGGKQGWFAVDSTNMRILTTTNATVYYYLFYDDQP
jgi:hypothetical protein